METVQRVAATTASNAAHPSTKRAAPAPAPCPGAAASRRAQCCGFLVNAHVTKAPAAGQSKLVKPSGVARTCSQRGV